MIPFRKLNGKIIDLEHIREDEIHIKEIAHALSMQCRYNGQISSFYSVAQHSIIVASYIQKMTQDYEIALCGLLHDAGEAYIGDVIAPLKNRLPLVKEIEDKLLGKILTKYGLKQTYIKNKKIVDGIDKHIYKKEVKYFFEGAENLCFYDDKPIENIKTLKRMFICEFNYYRAATKKQSEDNTNDVTI